MSQTADAGSRAAAPTPAGAAAAVLPDLLYGEAENELRAAVRALLADRAPWREVLARTESGEPYDTGLWRALAADVGCAGLLVPEAAGGAGASCREAAVVAEELGRAVAPVPFLGSAVLATVAAVSAGPVSAGGTVSPGGTVSAGAGELLAGLANGTTTAALAVPFATAPGSRPAPAVRLTGAGRGEAGGGEAAAGGETAAGGYRLTGTISGAADALPADVLLVPADGVPYGLYEVRADGPGVTRTPVVSLDMTRQLADLTLAGAPARQVAAGPAAERAVAAALTAGAAVLASEQLGVAERCLELTVAYVKERRQFARPVGSFQALKHRLAEVWVAVTQARAAARYAAACLAAGDPDTPVAVALAKSACSEAALLAAQEMVQLHGGIGFTWEHPAHLYLKRAKSGSIALGTPDRHRALLAELLNLPGPPARPGPAARPGPPSRAQAGSG